MGISWDLYGDRMGFIWDLYGTIMGRFAGNTSKIGCLILAEHQEYYVQIFSDYLIIGDFLIIF